jgi:hypothetical protein
MIELWYLEFHWKWFFVLVRRSILLAIFSSLGIFFLNLSLENPSPCSDGKRADNGDFMASWGRLAVMRLHESMVCTFSGGSCSCCAVLLRLTSRPRDLLRWLFYDCHSLDIDSFSIYLIGSNREEEICSSAYPPGRVSFLFKQLKVGCKEWGHISVLFLLGSRGSAFHFVTHDPEDKSQPTCP